jgi:hypothetical protein
VRAQPRPEAAAVHDDLGPPVAGLTDPICGRHPRILLAPADRDNVGRRDALAHELLGHDLGTPLRKLHIVAADPEVSV